MGVRPKMNVISLTDAAASRVKDIMANADKPIHGLRVGVKNGGCAGMSYTMEMAERAVPGDEVVEDKGVRILIDADSAPLIGGAEVDYVEDLMKSGFTIYNPNATSSCACGSSFASKDGGGQARPCHA